MFGCMVNACRCMFCWVQCIMAPVWSLAARIYLFIIFYKSALVKVNDIFNGKLEKVVHMFRKEFGMPLPEIVAPVASFLELILPCLLLVGLMTRISALALCAVTVYMHYFLIPNQSYLLWIFLSSYLFIHGGGKLSIDYMLCRRKSTSTLSNKPSSATVKSTNNPANRKKMKKKP